MNLNGLINRGRSYLDVTVLNIDVKQKIANEWFEDVLTYIKAEYGESKFYPTVVERLIKLSGYESFPTICPDNGKMNIPLVTEMQFRIKDYKYRMEAIINELELISQK